MCARPSGGGDARLMGAINDLGSKEEEAASRQYALHFARLMPTLSVAHCQHISVLIFEIQS